MMTEGLRIRRGALLHALIISLFLSTAPSDPGAAQQPMDAPSADEIALLEELAEWVDHGAAARRTPLRQVIRDHSTSFEVFRRFHGAARRHQRLEEIPYGAAIRQAAERHGVDGLLLAAMVEVESSFKPRVVSHRGAVGLMQVMPATAGSDNRTRLLDPEFNLDAGARYLRRLLERYEGDLALALAAYNAGPGNVRRYGGLPPFRETRRYVEKVLELYIGHHRQLWRTSETAEKLARL
ncbi:MAG: lytic transglycosylase domain-containing protein [bacterium]|nr:lytic transglycosylase domain-containing protein [bacterium]